jgi:hypothetical protein
MAGIAASCATCAGSLVSDGWWCSLPGTFYRWWPSLVAAGSLRVVRGCMERMKGGIAAQYTFLLQWVKA